MMVPPIGGGHIWHGAIIEHGAEALLAVADEFAKVPDTRALPNNILVEISERVSKEIRRRLLESSINTTKNLTWTANDLRMVNASAVSKEAKRLGVSLPKDRRKRGAARKLELK